jgi:hypothetical protein
VLETIFLALGLVKEAQDAFGPNEVLPELHWRPLFLSLRFVSVGLRTNSRFSTNLENTDHLEKYSKSLFDPGEF